MLDKNRVLAAFFEVLRLPEGMTLQGLKPRAVAHRAHRVYCANLAPEDKRPSPETFRKFATGPRALPEVVEALNAASVRTSERGRVDRARLLDAFQKAVLSLDGRTLRSSRVARMAQEIYRQGETGPCPSYHTFRRLLYGKTADPEIVALIRPAAPSSEADPVETIPAPTPKRARLDKKKLHDVFRRSVLELKTELLDGQAKPRDVARHARAIYLKETSGPAPAPSLHAFERQVYGRTSNPRIAALIVSAQPDQRLILKSFERALRELASEKIGEFRPRTVAVRAHRIYCAGLPSERKKPSLETFRKLATGRRALPEVGEMLKAASVHPTSRARLDRERLRAVFQEAVQRLEARILRGQAKPTQVARRAYEIYTRESNEKVSQPSRHTFQRLIYGKGADPEIVTLIRTALKGEE
jgi:hypothetical protein